MVILCLTFERVAKLAPTSSPGLVINVFLGVGKDYFLTELEMSRIISFYNILMSRELCVFLAQLPSHDLLR